MKISEKSPFASSGEEKRFTLRMDAEIFRLISIVAKDHKRSVAKEIEYAVEMYLVEIMDEEADKN